jgi:hypothetical protein
MSTSSKLEAARSKVGDVPYSFRASYTNVAALREILAGKERSVSAAFGQHPNPRPLDIGNSAGHPFHTATVIMAEYNNIKTAVDFLEATDEHKDAVALIQPLVDEVHRLEAQLAAEEFAANTAETQRREKFEAAKAAALAEVEARFSTTQPSKTNR